MATVDERIPQAPATADLSGLGGLRWRWFAAALGVLAISVVVGASTGPVALPPSEILRSALARIPFVHAVSGISARDEAILWSLRMPRVVLAGLVGGMLAIAGASYQGVFRNPLADPYLLGAAAGAELGATVAIVVAPTSSAFGVQVVALAAFAGASLAVVGAFALG